MGRGNITRTYRESHSGLCSQNRPFTEPDRTKPDGHKCQPKSNKKNKIKEQMISLRPKLPDWTNIGEHNSNSKLKLTVQPKC